MTMTMTMYRVIRYAMHRLIVEPTNQTPSLFESHHQSLLQYGRLVTTSPDPSTNYSSSISPRPPPAKPVQLEQPTQLLDHLVSLVTPIPRSAHARQYAHALQHAADHLRDLLRVLDVLVAQTAAEAEVTAAPRSELWRPQ